MRGSFRPQGRPALITFRISAPAYGSEESATISDVMLQPGGSQTGWLPHVTEMPWSAGITPDEEVSTVYTRLSTLESEVTALEDGLEGITVAGDVWQGDSISWDSRISSEWTQKHGWISWIDLDGLVTDGASGDLGFHFPPIDATGDARPGRWGVTIVTDDVPPAEFSGFDVGLEALVSDGSVSEVLGEASLAPFHTWTYRVQHDVQIPVMIPQLRPHVTLKGVTANSSGVVGLATPWAGTASEGSD